MKIALVTPPYRSFIKDHIGTPQAYEPLGLEYIAAAARAVGFDCDVLFDNPENPGDAARAIHGTGYDMVGIGAVTPGVPWSLELARHLKILSKEIKVIMGGDHASSSPDIVMNEGIDYVIQGEGEKSFTRLLECLKHGEPEDDIPGLVLKAGGEYRVVPKERICDIDSLPWPLRSKEILTKCRLTGLAYPAFSSQTAAAQLLYSRGCNRSCDYCASKNVFKNGVKYRNTDDVVEEIIELKRDYDVNLIYIADLNFAANLDKAEKLCDALIEAGSPVSWYTATTAESITERLAGKMAAAGCFKVAFGIESMNEKSHSRLKKWSRLEYVEPALRICDEAGIMVRGYYMVGIPDESIPELIRGIDTLCSMAVDEIRFVYFTPFYGTSAFDDYNHLLKYKTPEDFVHFTGSEAVMEIPGVPLEELMATYAWAWKRFYCGPEYKDRWKRKIERFPKYKESFLELFSFLKGNGIDIES